MKWHEIYEYIIIIAVVILIRIFLIDPAMVSGASMNDTLEDGQIVLVNKIVYKVNDIKRFDIVVVKNEVNNDKIIKRVIGLPNEKITYKDNKLYINDELVKVKYNIKETDDFEYTTLDGEYFVLGDNRPVSKDSRVLGPFTKKEIVGRVSFRLFPFSKFGRVDKNDK